MNLIERIKAVQRHYGLKDDGIAAVLTWTAIYNDVIGPDVVIPPDADVVDARSEANIITLLPQVQPYARALIHSAAARGIIAKVTSGFRSYEEQAKLHDAYLHGGPQATSPGNSAHNFGIGFDITLFEDDLRTPIYDSPDYKVAGELGRSIGLHWGADFGDEPHYAKRPPSLEDYTELGMMKELRRRHAAGEAIWS